MTEYPNNVLTIKTVQIAPFRVLMTALKDILLETNISFQKDGMRIINMDKSHTILAHLFLAAENFEHYECNQEKKRSLLKAKTKFEPVSVFPTGGGSGIRTHDPGYPG